MTMIGFLLGEGFSHFVIIRVIRQLPEGSILRPKGHKCLESATVIFVGGSVIARPNLPCDNPIIMKGL